MEGGPLLGDELNAEPIPESKVWNYFRDMLRGVSYMHSQGIVHRFRYIYVDHCCNIYDLCLPFVM